MGSTGVDVYEGLVGGEKPLADEVLVTPDSPEGLIVEASEEKPDTTDLETEPQPERSTEAVLEYGSKAIKGVFQNQRRARMNGNPVWHHAFTATNPTLRIHTR